MIIAKGTSWDGVGDGTNDVYANTVSVATEYTAAGAIAIKNGLAVINNNSAIAMTLADPIAGIDDGKKLIVVAKTSKAHTLTVASAFDGTHTVATYSTVGQNIAFIAINGKWYLQSYVGVTLS